MARICSARAKLTASLEPGLRQLGPHEYRAKNDNAAADLAQRVQ
jgi:hypothetical protein